MSRIITGILLKSYMAVARLMGEADKRKKRSSGKRARTTLSKTVKRIKLKEA